MIRLEVGQATDRGLHREKNEDSMLVADELFAVADGLGGHRGGEVASALAVETLAAEVKAVVEARTENRRPLFRRRPLLPYPGWKICWPRWIGPTRR